MLPLLLPSGFAVEKSKVMACKREEVYKVVSDFRTWKSWGYWCNWDAYAEWVVTPKVRGWSSNDKRVSVGNMFVQRQQYPEFLEWRVNLPKDKLLWRPRVSFDQLGDSVRVTFSLNDEFSYFGRLRYLFYDFETEVGNGFDNSLHHLSVYMGDSSLVD